MEIKIKRWERMDMEVFFAQHNSKICLKEVFVTDRKKFSCKFACMYDDPPHVEYQVDISNLNFENNDVYKLLKKSSYKKPINAILFFAEIISCEKLMFLSDGSNATYVQVPILSVNKKNIKFVEI